MFLFFRKNVFLKKACFAALVFLAAMLAGCSNGTTDNGDVYTVITMPEDLKETWVSIWDEEYTITETTFTSGWGGTVNYEGDIVNIRGKNGSNDAGYITIQYTNNANDPEAVGKYYVIHYKNLTSSTPSIAGAGKEDDPDFAFPKAGGKATKQEAEAAYTLENGYFGMYSTVAKANNEGPETPVPAILIDEWSGTDDLESEHTFRITGTTLTYSMDSSPFFRANIVKVNERDDDSGYLVFQYILFNSPNKDDLVGKYCVLYYEGLTADGVNLAVFNENGNIGDVGEANQADAETVYVIEDDTFYDSDHDLISYTK